MVCPWRCERAATQEDAAAGASAPVVKGFRKKKILKSRFLVKGMVSAKEVTEKVAQIIAV